MMSRWDTDVDGYIRQLKAQAAALLEELKEITCEDQLELYIVSIERGVTLGYSGEEYDYDEAIRKATPCTHTRKPSPGL